MNSLKKIALLSIVAVGALFIYHGSALAQGYYVDDFPTWSHVGSACAVDEADLNLFRFDGPAFAFKSGAVSRVGLAGLRAPITARCNVVSPIDMGNPKWTALYVDYVDPDGQGTSYRVQATLYRVDRTTGATTTVTTFDSNTFGDMARVEHRKDFTHTFDFLHSEYFIAVMVTRADVRGDPQLRSVRLVYYHNIPG